MCVFPQNSLSEIGLTEVQHPVILFKLIFITLLLNFFFSLVAIFITLYVLDYLCLLSYPFSGLQLNFPVVQAPTHTCMCICSSFSRFYFCKNCVHFTNTFAGLFLTGSAVGSFAGSVAYLEYFGSL